MTRRVDDRDFLLAARAVEQEIVTADQLAETVRLWTASEGSAGTGRSLLDMLTEVAGLNADARGQLDALVDAVESLPDTDLAESMDDSFFGKLNSALGSVDSDQLKASMARWEKARSASLEIVDDGQRFEVIKEHARGGLGEVLLARDRQLNRQVALKRIREKWASHEQARSRFQLEAEITGRLEHPGVVPVYALGRRADGEIYYAMRFIRGSSLEEATAAFHCAAGGAERTQAERVSESTASGDFQSPKPQPANFQSADFQSANFQSANFQSVDFRSLLRRFVDVCNTIDYAHSRGVIHRDLKPANIMLGRYGETLVVDWGLAKQVGVEEERLSDVGESRILSDTGSGSAPTQFGSAVGTPQYMSPEQAAGRLDRMGPLTDVFGLGATLYQVLTNEPPQREDQLQRVLDRVEHGEFPRPSALNSGVPKGLEAICLKAMSVRPAQRYESPRALSDDIERWMADEPVSVHRDSLATRMIRWVKRNQTLAVASAVAGVLIITGGVIWSEIQHSREQREAQIEQDRQVRLTRLSDSLELTEKIVREQLDNGRFDSATSMLEKEIKILAPESTFADERARLIAMADRIRRISEYRMLARKAQEANYLALDQDEVSATVRGLGLLGVWDNPEWWNHLPGQDLRIAQQEQLQDDVYRSLALLASTLLKQTATKTLKGQPIPEDADERMALYRSEDGRAEGLATLRICDMASRFRYAECLRWYRGMAAFRLTNAPVLVRPWQLKPPRNAADAYELGILTVTRAASPVFPFSGYRDVQDDLMSAQETMAIASEMGPQEYWVHLVLAQSQYLAAQAAAEPDPAHPERFDPEAWQKFDTCRQTFGRCISLQPDLPFAYSDLSTICLLEYEVLPRSQILRGEDGDTTDIDRRRADLLESCVKYAEEGLKRGDRRGFIHWHHGHALLAVGRVEDAMAAYALAVQLNFRFRADSLDSLVDMEEIRGTGRMIPRLTAMVEQGDQRSCVLAALAGGHVSRGHFATARRFAEQACEAEEVPDYAWTIRGLIALHDEDWPLARSCFEKAVRLNPTAECPAIGLGQVCLSQQNDETARLSLERAFSLVRTDHHASDILLMLCGIQVRAGDPEAAAQGISQARRLHPACTMDDILAEAERLGAASVIAAIEANPPISADAIAPNFQPAACFDVPVHNGGFERPLSPEWSNPDYMPWQLEGDGESEAIVQTGAAHSGQGALHVRARGFNSGSRAVTRQTITVVEEETYTVRFWVKSKQTNAGAVYLAVEREGQEDLTPLMEIPAGAFDWTCFEGQFQAPRPRVKLRGEKFAGLTHQTKPMTLFVVAEGDCDVLIDDISITRVEAKSNGEAR
ncbi:MAG: protein kinase [Planctomycetaceae bacterium]|nr:protein kinase [Planctomycetaceae bacterium]